VSIEKAGNRLELWQVPEPELNITSASTTYNLTARDQNVRISTGSSPATIYLPYVADAAGKLYSVALVTTGTSAATIADHDDSLDWAGDITLDAQYDRALLYSDGQCWWTLVDMYT